MLYPRLEMPERRVPLILQRVLCSSSFLCNRSAEKKKDKILKIYLSSKKMYGFINPRLTKGGSLPPSLADDSLLHENKKESDQTHQGNLSDTLCGHFAV